MSLLMDALKKAEEAKRQSEAAGKTEPQEAASASPGTDERGLPELPSRLELLDHEFHAPDAKAAPAATPAEPEVPAAEERSAPKPAAEAVRREQAAAQNVFQSKQQPRKTFLVFAGLGGLVAAAALGGYFWWQLQPQGGIGVSPTTARTPAPATPIAAAPAAPVQPAVPAPAPAAAAPMPTMPAAAPEPAPAAPRPAAVSPAPTLSEPAVAKKPAAEAESPIRITTSRLKINPQIASAYQAFQAGDLDAALRDYQLALKGDPKNGDALHGMAAISLRQGRPEAAETFYLRALEADPKDGLAQAGLIGLRGQVDPTQSESRLKNLLASQPESPTLNFALGNLYAQQGRWNDAQQAYFRAYAGDSENPDYQFNLAVSLEQLRQPKLALQYYQGALAAATQRPAAFDRNLVAGRISELQK